MGKKRNGDDDEKHKEHIRSQEKNEPRRIDAKRKYPI